METMQANQCAAVATFDTRQQAEQGVKELQKSGFGMNNLPIVGMLAGGLQGAGGRCQPLAAFKAYASRAILSLLMGGAIRTRNQPFHCASINYDGIMSAVSLKNVRTQASAINRFALTAPHALRTGIGRVEMWCGSTGYPGFCATNSSFFYC
ncbi:hypothetical protein [Sulfuriferula plumbiphila]|uniref:hypothetical protein n=1 Tax=Sulfuriferula plumbiphila TaxID=171865 RepID=UPI0011BE9610|nr:hypothetical protein [Sulfuriferula plumbiphila]